MNFRQVVDDPLPPFIVAEGEINFEFPVHLFLVDPFEGVPPSIQILYIAEFDGKILAAIPHSAWHRTISKPAIPASCLTKTSLLEVQACRMSNRVEAEPEEKLKLWVREVSPYLHCRFQVRPLLRRRRGGPTASLCSVAGGCSPRALCLLFSSRRCPFGRSPCRRRGAHRRIWISTVPFGESLEAGRNYGLCESGDATAAGKRDNGSSRFSYVRPPKKSAMRKETEVTLMPKGNPKMKPGPKFPMLDQGVVAAALQAGVSEANLQGCKG